MGAYEYSVVDEKGREKKGTIEGDTAKHARQKLREKGWMPINVIEVTESAKAKSGFGINFRRGISTKDLALITRQLATLVRAALPVEEALRTTAQQSEKQNIKRILVAVRARVMEGHTLADGLSDFTNVFPDLYIATVRAGEQTGHLDMVLERLADYVESRQVIQQKVMQAMIYPIALTVIALSVVVGLLIYVVPEIVQVFQSTGQKLPDLTLFMIAISEFLQNNGLFLIPAIIVIIVGFMFAMTKDPIKFKVHQFYLRLPIIKKLIRGMNTSRFARTFSILTGSGVPILEGLKISSKVIGNLPMRAAVIDATLRIREGASISKSLEQSRQFPPMTQNLIASGESSGKLEEMLDRAAASQEREIESTIGTMLALMEPLLIVVMGAMVMLIVLAVLMPIFEMNDLVK